MSLNINHREFKFLLGGGNVPEVKSSTINMSSCRHFAGSASMLFYEPCLEDFIPSTERRLRVNIDCQLVKSLLDDLATIGRIILDMAGIEELDWNEKGSPPPSRIPTEFLDRIGIRAPSPVSIHVAIYGPRLYQADMEPGRALAWLRVMQDAGLEDIQWIRDAAYHIALLSHTVTGWRIEKAHFRKLPRKYATSVEDLWHPIDRVFMARARDADRPLFNVDKPSTWCTNWYHQRTLIAPPLYLLIEVEEEDAPLMDRILEMAWAAQYDLFDPLTPPPRSREDSVLTSENTEALFRPSPPILCYPDEPPVNAFDAQAVEAVVGFARAYTNQEAADHCRDDRDSDSDTGKSWNSAFPDLVSDDYPATTAAEQVSTSLMEDDQLNEDVYSPGENRAESPHSDGQCSNGWGYPQSHSHSREFLHSKEVEQDQSSPIVTIQIQGHTRYEHKVSFSLVMSPTQGFKEWTV